MFRFAALLVPAAVLAGETAGNLDPLLSYVLNFGILGVMTVLWLTNRIKTAGDLAKAEARADAAEKAKGELEAVFRGEVIPAMTRFTDVATRLLDRGIK